MADAIRDCRNRAVHPLPRDGPDAGTPGTRHLSERAYRSEREPGHWPITCRGIGCVMPRSRCHGPRPPASAPRRGDRRRDTMADEPAVPRSFPVAFADALRRRGVSLAWLHERLVERGRPVSPAALSYWRSGRSQPERGTSREALVEIERLLRSLRARSSTDSGLRAARPRPGRRPSASCSATSRVSSPPSRAGFEGLYDELVEVLRHLTVDVDETGRRRPCRCGVVQARRDGARRTPLIVTLRDRRRPSPPSALRAPSQLVRPLLSPPRATDLMYEMSSSCLSRGPRPASTTMPPGAWVSCWCGCGSRRPGCRRTSSGTPSSTGWRRSTRSPSAVGRVRMRWRAASGRGCSGCAGPGEVH